MSNIKRELKGFKREGYKKYLIFTKRGRKQFSGHRLIWAQKTGSLSELAICHKNNIKDDNRIDNLYAATNAQNSTDAARDGLYRCGEENPATKTTKETVIKIRQEYKTDKVNQKDLALKYNLSVSNIGYIINGEIWKKM